MNDVDGHWVVLDVSTREVSYMLVFVVAYQLVAQSDVSHCLYRSSIEIIQADTILIGICWFLMSSSLIVCFLMCRAQHSQPSPPWWQSRNGASLGDTPILERHPLTLQNFKVTNVGTTLTAVDKRGNGAYKRGNGSQVQTWERLQSDTVNVDVVGSAVVAGFGCPPSPPPSCLPLHPPPFPQPSTPFAPPTSPTPSPPNEPIPHTHPLLTPIPYPLLLAGSVSFPRLPAAFGSIRQSEKFAS